MSCQCDSWELNLGESRTCTECGLTSTCCYVDYCTKAERDILTAAYAYVAAQRAVPADFDLSDPCVDELLAARDALIEAVEA